MIELDVSTAALVNAGGALLFALDGVAVLAIGRGSRRSLLVGGLAAAFGLSYVVENVVRSDGEALPTILFLAFAVPTNVLAWLLARDLAKPLAARAKAALGVLAALAALAVVGTVVIGEMHARSQPLPGSAPLLALRLLIYPNLATAASLGVLVAVCAARVRDGRDAAEAGRMAMLALAFGLWAGFSAMLPVALSAQWPDAAAQACVFLLCLVAIACAAWWVPGPLCAAPRLARATFAALAGAILVGILLSPTFIVNGPVYGAFGMLRTVGAVFLALAVVKYDLLGVPLPKVVVKRGVLAGGALAALFIVAQVAQNFFAAEYGLLMGGIVAGAVVFAASPIQRAMERAGKMDGSPKPRKTQEDAYKSAVRLALRGGITRREELDLARIAEAHGIGPVRALELRGEAETEAGRKGGGR